MRPMNEAMCACAHERARVRMSVRACAPVELAHLGEAAGAHPHHEVRVQHLRTGQMPCTSINPL